MRTSRARAKGLSESRWSYVDGDVRPTRSIWSVRNRSRSRRSVEDPEVLGAALCDLGSAPDGRQVADRWTGGS